MGHVGSGEGALGLAVGGLGVAADVLVLCTLPSKGSSDLPLQNREHISGEVEMGQARWPFLSRRGPEAGSEGDLLPGQDRALEGSAWSPEEASSIRWPR